MQNKMEQVIGPIDKQLLREEIKKAPVIEEASRGNAVMHIVDCHYPAILQEVGRIRELAFRERGAGTGKACDLDRFDLDPALGFQQLVLWDTEAEEVMGGYRIVTGDRWTLDANGQPDLPSARLFHFSQAFIDGPMRKTVELSRSFIAAEYQRNSEAVRKNIFTLDCLLQGIAAVTVRAGMEHFFGKVTFYPDYPAEALSIVNAFMKAHCEDSPELIQPHRPFTPKKPKDVQEYTEGDFQQYFRSLVKRLREKGYALPPILKSYMGVCSLPVSFYGFTVDPAFGGVTEMGLICHINAVRKDRFTALSQ